MQTIKLEEIVISSSRQRQEFDPESLMELTESIRERGLLHAPVLREEAGKFLLVAGERRIKAIQDLWALGDTLVFNNSPIPEGLIPYVTLGQLNPLDAEEAELDENIRRRDLTWQELASVHERLHSLRQRQAEKVGKVHSVADTALELTGRSDGAYQGTVRKELIVAKHLDDTEVSKAKSVDEAFKILKRKEESRRNVEAAIQVGKTLTVASHTLLNVDCLQWMATCPEGIFDVICTDPPYGMGADNFGDAAGKLTSIEHHYDDSLESWQQLMQEWSHLSWRVTKLQAHCYICCDFDRFHELKLLMQAAGWYVFRTPIINQKVGSGRVPLPEHGPRRQYEIIMYCIKGKKPVTHIYPDVMQTQADQNDGHGATKPIAMYQNLLQRSVRPGDLVLDSFCGSGGIFPAAHSFKCLATGLEISPEYYGLSMKRLQAMEVDDEI